MLEKIPRVLIFSFSKIKGVLRRDSEINRQIWDQIGELKKENSFHNPRVVNTQILILQYLLRCCTYRFAKRGGKHGSAWVCDVGCGSSYFPSPPPPASFVSCCLVLVVAPLSSSSHFLPRTLFSSLEGVCPPPRPFERRFHLQQWTQDRGADGVGGVWSSQ